MYNQYLKILQTKAGVGSGVFTTVEIPAGVPILEFSGTLYNSVNMPEHQANLQVGPDLFIGPSGGVDDYVNHSCNPNCLLHIVGNRAILYSLNVIIKDVELTFDYSTSSTDTHDKWKMECLCGAYNCRKVISGLHYLNDETKDAMKKRGMIPLFLTNPIFR
jgi:hypothetical protein